MDKSLFEKYINEMRAMHAAARPAPAISQPAVTPTIPDENSENMTGNGRLIVNVTSVRGLYPIENARVTVFTGSADNMRILAEAVTDRSGKTPAFELPAPSSVYTEAPEPTERPYAYFNIKTAADGFVDTFNFNSAVFDGITSVQSVSLFPVTTGVDGNRPIIIDGADNYAL